MEEQWYRTRLCRSLTGSRWVLHCLVVGLWLLQTVDSIIDSNVCMEKQKYNVTKRIKYRAPMSVRTYEWCLAVPPRCSRWTTEMRDLTRLETEERTMDVAVCCPGFSIKGGSCHPKCPSGKTGHNCTEECPRGRWGPSCSQECSECPAHASCSPYSGNCVCDDNWKGERCEKSTDDAATIPIAPSNALTKSYIDLTTTQSTKTNTFTPTTNPTEENTETLTIPLVTERTTFTATTPKFTTPATIPTAKTNDYTSQTMENATKAVFESMNFTNLKKENNSSKAVETQKTTEIQKTVTNAPSIVTIADISREDITFDRTFNDVINVTNLTTLKPITNATASLKYTTKIVKHITDIKDSKPKEIWIKPTQKGDSILLESQNKTALLTSFKTRNFTKYQLGSDGTTPRTIVVSIIPTSSDYTAVFKKITINGENPKVNFVQNSHKNSSSVWKIITVTKTHSKMITTTNANHTINNIPDTKSENKTNVSYSFLSTFYPFLIRNVSANTMPPWMANDSYSMQSSITSQSITNRYFNLSTPHPTLQMHVVPHLSPHTAKSTTKALSSTFTTLTPITSSPNFLINSTAQSTARLKQTNNTSLTTRLLQTLKFESLETSITGQTIPKSSKIKIPQKNSTKEKIVEHHQIVVRFEPSTLKPTTVGDVTFKPVKSSKLAMKADIETVNSNKQDSMGAVTNLTYTNRNLATNNDPTNAATEPVEDEVFGVLTEPEHITAIMDGGTERNTDNLLSVLSIAGGVMFATITVAVVIVMMERCRRARYEDLMKSNEVRMRGMEGDEEPPPYVRSIFHTPLPDPPVLEKSHYQPISTLDRNLKQFMRPVAVQSISPIMMENFRGILECHYDHLPPRSSHISFRSDTTSQYDRSSMAPSVGCPSELFSQQSPMSDKKLPVTELSVETLRLEGNIFADPTTSEPLYAEIPFWRPPSQHASEIVNLSGEAVTEL